MKKHLLIITLLLLSIFPGFCQKKPVNEFSVIDKKALAIPDSLCVSTAKIASYINQNFTDNNTKIRAIFIWIATNIQYDIENVYALNFYEKQEEKVDKVLKNRKGICANYAALFYDLCTKVGIKSFVIEGYTKQNGFTDYIPHAWCAARIDTSWFIFDPTWGSGYVNGGKFYKKINNDYYKVSPTKIIKSHMPFDYLWQFLNYPITNQEFYDGKILENKSKPYFNFNDSIAVYEKQIYEEQLAAIARRIENNGLKNSMLFDRLQHIKLELERINQQRNINLYNSAVDSYNAGTLYYNEFIEYKNKQFFPKKSDEEIQQMIDLADSKLIKSKAKLNEMSTTDQNMLNSKNQLNSSIDNAFNLVKEQKDWLKVYFSKSPNKRKSMFFEQKTTIFGIPIK